MFITVFYAIGLQQKLARIPELETWADVVKLLQTDFFRPTPTRLVSIKIEADFIRVYVRDILDTRPSEGKRLRRLVRDSQTRRWHYDSGAIKSV